MGVYINWEIASFANWRLWDRAPSRPPYKNYYRESKLFKTPGVTKPQAEDYDSNPPVNRKETNDIL